MADPIIPHCRYCGTGAMLAHSGQPDYPYQRDYGPTWVCTPCGAWVGCHPGTLTALGALANAELRAWKQKAHAAFDPLWKCKMARDKCSQSKARKAGYLWLARKLGIPLDRAHIGEMNVAECKQTVQICEAIKMK